MNDKSNHTLRVGDIVTFNKNVSPRYVADAVCVVDKIDRYSGKLTVTIEKMRPGGPTRRRTYSEGMQLRRVPQSIVTKMA